MIRKKSREELMRQMLRGIVQETEVTMVGKGSVSRGLASVFSGTIEEMYQTLDDTVNNSFLPTAQGFYLDLFGETFGLTRKLPAAGQVSASDRVIRFYVTSGTLAQKLPHPTDLNLGRVPAGATVSSTSGVTYTVDADYDFPAAAKLAYVGATTSATGTAQNVGAGDLSTTSLAEVLVTNISGISSATDLESDEEYRFRISRWVRSSAGRNEVAVRLAVFNAPNVADMIKQPYFAGPGSFRIIIIPTNNRVSVETLRQAYSNLASVVSDGTFFIVEPPRYLPVSLSVRLIPRAGNSITATERDLAQQAALNYLGDIRPGESLIINQLRAAVLSSSSTIADLRLQGLTIDRRPRALLNYTLERDEVFVPDDTLVDPIVVI